MEKFKIGDRIIANSNGRTGDSDRLMLKNEKGTIIDVKHDTITIKCDNDSAIVKRIHNFITIVKETEYEIF